ncbi:MAG: trimethylamine methyltransferase family protein [Candidatus Promineifilaceae bacterium]|jgi:trimethylamine--corrinoid protein Co-methyltransferase
MNKRTRPILELISQDLIEQILDEAFQLLQSPGFKVKDAAVRNMLAEAGARVQENSEIVHLPEQLGRWALDKAPNEFWLYDREGRAAVQYGGDNVHFNPGSSGVNILDPVQNKHRPAETLDLLNLIKVTEGLDSYDAQSTAVICHDIPEELGDVYRLYLVLLHSNKPIVTGAFTTPGAQRMFEMLALAAGSRENMKAKPTAVFDVCPTPPLVWSEFGARNLVDLARAGLPAQIVSMPLAGAAAPVTLLGSVVQHAAECISGITIHQLAQPGAPIVWGGAPAIFDMRFGTTPMGAVETAMIDAAYAQVGKALGLPTHAYLGASDAKIIDAQAGLESGLTALVGAQAGINMISGPGMLDFLACQSAEKLVIDAEAVAMSKRLVEGVTQRTDPLATDMYDDFSFKADFLRQKITRSLFRQEQYLTSPVIDRNSLRAWKEAGSQDIVARAQSEVQRLLVRYEVPAAPAKTAPALRKMMSVLASEVGLSQLPKLTD